MARLLRLVGLAALGYLVARVAGLTGLDDSTWYLYGTALLLGIGLFGSTYSIDVDELRRDGWLVLVGVTGGVLAKAVLIGGSLALAFRDPVFLILGVAVAQIDPLSVAALMGDKRMSPRAKSILAAWASFDDPITVILSVYAISVLQPDGQGLGVGYGVDLLLNLAFAAVAYLLWLVVRRHRVLAFVGLAVLFAVAVSQFLMLGLAIAGLFYRPPLDRVVARVTQGALAVAVVLLGMLLVGGISVGRGAALGAAAFGAQIVVGWLLTRHLPRLDRVHLAFAQQNGITAIILALRLEAYYAGSVAVIAPAILVTNTIFIVANHLVDRRERRRTPAPETS
ncbi:MAG TPA: cation:proton antiporter [Micromonosporaceae bacterium]|nr:cation:proton antiporter [Micromonosporaceae bacterium]